MTRDGLLRPEDVKTASGLGWLAIMIVGLDELSLQVTTCLVANSGKALATTVPVSRHPIPGSPPPLVKLKAAGT